YEMSLPFGLDLNNQINVDKSATRMVVTLRGTTTTEISETEERARLWLQEHGLEEMATYGSGLSVIWAHLSERNIDAMLGASLWALVLISGILILALRSFKIGLLSLIPNLAPAFMAFGIWGLTVGKVGLGLSVIVSMTIGIVVDDTVHFLSKYLRARREHLLSPPEAVRYAFSTVGMAMCVTTFALVSGWLVVSFSHYAMNSDMAIMTAITITLALALDFLLLPALLMKVEERTDEITESDLELESGLVPVQFSSRGPIA
ncbi:MAG: MMPL family transporter, partial [bacterium]|nr:MMPL family transporter [bacterium]